MSIRRIRKLAGLNETITSDPAVNAEIERRLHSDNKFAQDSNLWLDMLEIIQEVGRNGISPAGLSTRMKEIHGRATTVLRQMIPQLATKFDNVVRTDHRGWLFWKEPESDIESEVDPMTRQAIGAQVDLTYEALDLMRSMTRDRGSFTQDELVASLSRVAGVPRAIAAAFAEHIIAQFRSMLIQNVAGHYIMKPEPVTNRGDSMQFFRDLEANARNKGAVQPSVMPAPREHSGEYLVKHNDEVMFSGTHNQCFAYIMNHQSQSVDWAIKYEGWEIVPNNDEE